jgi:hypothetical protein
MLCGLQCFVFPPPHNARKLTLMPVRILTDIMTRMIRKEKDASVWMWYCGNSITGSASHKHMVIVSKFTLVEKEPRTGVFC